MNDKLLITLIVAPILLLILFTYLKKLSHLNGNLDRIIILGGNTEGTCLFHLSKYLEGKDKEIYDSEYQKWSRIIIWRDIPIVYISLGSIMLFLFSIVFQELPDNTLIRLLPSSIIVFSSIYIQKPRVLYPLTNIQRFSWVAVLGYNRVDIPQSSKKTRFYIPIRSFLRTNYGLERSLVDHISEIRAKLNLDPLTYDQSITFLQLDMRRKDNLEQLEMSIRWQLLLTSIILTMMFCFVASFGAFRGNEFLNNRELMVQFAYILAVTAILMSVKFHMKHFFNERELIKYLKHHGVMTTPKYLLNDLKKYSEDSFPYVNI